MKTRKTIIAASIAALLLSGNAFATENREFHEQLWDQIKSYGDVLLAEDSVGNWGPWADFVEPAAGAPSPALLPGAGGSDPYKNIPNTLTEGCVAGAWCGYAIYQNTGGREMPPKATLSKVRPPESSWYAGSFSLTLNRDTPDSSTGSAFWRLTGLNPTDPSPAYDNAGANIPADFGGGTYSPAGKIFGVKIPAGFFYDNRDDSTSHFNGSSGNETDTGYESSSVSGFSHNIKATETGDAIPGTKLFKQPFELAANRIYWDTKNNAWAQNDEVAIGVFQRRVSTYVTGNEEVYAFSDGYDKSSATTGYYVVGVATPQAYLADQQTRNIGAHYVGGSFDGMKQGMVSIDVKFGSGDWQGTWSAADKSSFTFTAYGKIIGANIVADTKTGVGGFTNSNLSGYVNGTFYGQTAGSIGGVSSVTRNTSPETRSIAVTPTTQTSIFLVNKVASGPVVPAISPK